MAHPSTFYPQRTKTPTQKYAYKHTDVPKRAQIPSKSSFFSAPHILRVPVRPSPSRRFKSDLQLNPPVPPYPCSFHLLYRDSNSGLIEGFVRWGIASYPGTFYGPHDISRLLSYFRYSQSILYREVTSLLMKRSERGKFCARRKWKFSVSEILCYVSCCVECDVYREHYYNMHMSVVKDAEGWERFEVGRTCFGLIPRSLI